MFANGTGRNGKCDTTTSTEMSRISLTERRIERIICSVLTRIELHRNHKNYSQPLTINCTWRLVNSWHTRITTQRLPSHVNIWADKQNGVSLNQSHCTGEFTSKIEHRPDSKKSGRNAVAIFLLKSLHLVVENIIMRCMGKSGKSKISWVIADRVGWSQFSFSTSSQLTTERGWIYFFYKFF